MTEDAAAQQAVTAGPRLIHTGTYAVYQTPAGGVHVVWRRTAAADPDRPGEVRRVEGADDEHMPDIPPEAIPLIERFLAVGIPDNILAVLQGKSSPIGLLRELVTLNGGGGQADDDGQAADDE